MLALISILTIIILNGNFRYIWAESDTWSTCVKISSEVLVILNDTVLADCDSCTVLWLCFIEGKRCSYCSEIVWCYNHIKALIETFEIKFIVYWYTNCFSISCSKFDCNICTQIARLDLCTHLLLPSIFSNNIGRINKTNNNFYKQDTLNFMDWSGL